MNTTEVKAFFEKTDVYLTYNYNLRIMGLRRSGILFAI